MKMNIQGVHPTILAPMQAQSTSGSSSTGTSSSGSMSGSNLQTTFLNLLVTELQNQDPTQPVDPTQMVSQMVSLNELDQLISINQTLSSMSTTASSSSSAATNASGASTTVPGQPLHTQTHSAASLSPTGSAAAEAAAKYLAAPATAGLMNLYGSYGLPATN
jgi:flagellar basal-body rod modification protein FlgD